MTSNYPIMLRLEGKRIVVVGGGKVAERKVSGLLGTGATIEVISPNLTDELERLAQDGQIQWFQKSFSIEDIDQAFMIFAATNDSNINQLIKKAAGAHQLITIADDPDNSDFHVPAQVKRGRLTIAVSTGGASPILAGKITKQLSCEFDEQYEEYVEFLYWARRKILNEVTDPSVKKKLLTEIVSPKFLYSDNREADFVSLFPS
ncbi:MAG TPA: NAD(P)-binding protein [Bacillales bacterium]|nr:NAD(P)-binding protein [Bacillales bacterium]